MPNIIKQLNQSVNEGCLKVTSIIILPTIRFSIIQLHPPHSGSHRLIII